MDTVRFGVIGCGSIGQRHLALVHDHPSAALGAICDIDEEKCREYSAKYGGVSWFTDYKDLLKEKEIQAVIICTPHFLHAPMAIKAAKRGKHILVEKPMALRKKDCSKMIEAAETHDVKLMVVKQNRFNEAVQMARRAIDMNALGKIFMVQCNVIWNRGQEYYDHSDWRGLEKTEGGALFTQASHFIDLLVSWLGNLTDASTLIDTLNHEIEIEDCGSAVLRFESGTIGSLLWTTCAFNKNFEGSITLIGEKGTIRIGGQYLDRIDAWELPGFDLPADKTFNEQPNIYPGYQGTSSNHDKVLDLFISELKEGKLQPGDDSAMQAVEAIEFIYKKKQS